MEQSEQQQSTKLVTPSILSAIVKLRELLTREEKIKWLAIVGFALAVSLLEVVTASVIVVFAQVLNEPTVGQSYLTKLGITTALSPGRMVFYMSIAVGVVYLIKNLTAAVEVFFQNFTIQKMCYEFKNKLLHRYAGIDYGFYLTRNSSFGLQVISGDAEQTFSNAMVSMANIISEGIIFICLVGMIIYMNPGLAVIIFGIAIGLGLVVTKVLLPQFYSWGQKLQQLGIASGQHLMQFFHAFKEIVLLGKREEFVGAYQIHSKQKARVQAIQTATNNLPRIGIEIFFVGIFVLTISYLCIGHESPMKMVGLLSGYLYAGFRLMPGLNRIINQLNTFKSMIPSIERAHSEYTTVAADQHYIDVPEFKFNQSIKFTNVDFKYLNTEQNALAKINLKINKGERIGIVGETGSGKSTLVDLILGLLKPNNGAILIDDKYPVNCPQWHSKIGYVPQSVYLTDDTIEANIAFGEQGIDINEQQINRVIDIVQLRKLIDSLPNGTKTIVGERGIRLSGGERQRIAIARALYREPQVLIFDEATSALDNETEERLMETINAVSQDRTVIMIAHRVTTLKGCDRIVQMNNCTIEAIKNYQDINVTGQQYA
jgi:ATP-binding cassette subfamily C protein